jgi:hypothetical protein
LGCIHEGTRAQYIFHNRSRKEAEETIGRIEFQQFKTEEMETTEEKRGIVHRGKRHPIRRAKHRWREQERIFKTAIESATNRGIPGG